MVRVYVFLIFTKAKVLNIETQPPQLTPTTNGVNILLKTRATTIKILFSVISEHLRIVESNVVRGRSYIDRNI